MPLRTSHLLIAELPFGLLDTIPILGLTCFGGLAIGLMQSHPASPAVVLLVIALSMLSLLLTQQFVGAIKRPRKIMILVKSSAASAHDRDAVDKVIGWALREGRLPLAGCVLMVSGRVSFEVVQKALVARLPVIAAVSAPS